MAPFGYRQVGYKGKDGDGHDVDTRTFEVVPEEAAVVREIIEQRSAAGETLTRIGDDLTRRGVVSDGQQSRAGRSAQCDGSL